MYQEHTSSQSYQYILTAKRLKSNFSHDITYSVSCVLFFLFLHHFPLCLEVMCTARYEFLSCDADDTNSSTFHIICGQLCDKTPNCENGYDESNCEYFLCDDGVSYIPKHSQCDNQTNCPDGSDEEKGCLEMGPLFVCKDGETKTRYAACDGLFDCLG